MGRRLLAAVALAGGAVFAISGCAPQPAAPERNEQGAVSAKLNNADVFTLRVGDCVNVNSGANANLRAVAVVPCEESHKAEIYHAFDNTAENYPGEAELQKVGNETCLAQFKGFVGREYEESTLEVWPVYPSAASWEADDRQTLCVVASSGRSLTGTLKGKDI